MLTAPQWETLEAIVNRVIPPDEFPGGWEAGVGDYLRRQLDGGDLTDRLALYAAGLDAVEREAPGFTGLAPAAQDAVLTRIEMGGVTGNWPIVPERFFSMLVSHVMEGFYADPGQGGNRDGIAWQMIGFEVTA